MLRLVRKCSWLWQAMLTSNKRCVAFASDGTNLLACVECTLALQGRLVYGGEAEQALAHFEAHGHECPPHYNPAEFLADLISKDQSSEDAAAESEKRLQTLIAAAPSAFNAACESLSCVRSDTLVPSLPSFRTCDGGCTT